MAKIRPRESAYALFPLFVPPLAVFARVGVLGSADRMLRLLAAGADPGSRDVSGRTARDRAEWANMSDVVLLLQGAPPDR
jgi:hypothetical protein